MKNAILMLIAALVAAFAPPVLAAEPTDEELLRVYKPGGVVCKAYFEKGYQPGIDRCKRAEAVVAAKAAGQYDGMTMEQFVARYHPAGAYCSGLEGRLHAQFGQSLPSGQQEMLAKCARAKQLHASAQMSRGTAVPQKTGYPHGESLNRTFGSPKCRTLTGKKCVYRKRTKEEIRAMMCEIDGPYCVHR